MAEHSKGRLFGFLVREFRRLRGKATTRAYSLHDAPVSVHDELMAGIDAILAKPDV